MTHKFFCSIPSFFLFLFAEAGNPCARNNEFVMGSVVRSAVSTMISLSCPWFTDTFLVAMWKTRSCAAESTIRGWVFMEWKRLRWGDYPNGPQLLHTNCMLQKWRARTAMGGGAFFLSPRILHLDIKSFLGGDQQDQWVAEWISATATPELEV